RAHSGCFRRHGPLAGHGRAGRTTLQPVGRQRAAGAAARRAPPVRRAGHPGHHTMKRHLLVNAFSCASPAHTWSGLWTHPDSSGLRYNTLAYWAEMARTCEEGLLDGVFIADALGVPDVYEGKPDAMLRSGSFVPSLD